MGKNRKMTESLSKAVDIYIIAVFCVFPLFFTNAYFNILESKYYFYVSCVILLCLAAAATWLVSTQRYNFKGIFNTFSITDFALCGFILVAVISTFSSDYVLEAFWGNGGRYSGLFLLLLYAVSYFLISRFGKFKKWYLDAFLVVGAAVCLLGILDYFGLDLLRLKVNMKDTQKAMFTSTIGNINTYTSVVGILAGLSSVLFAFEKALTKKIFYASVIVVSFFALIMGVSDNAYLALAALLCILPFFLFKTLPGIRHYLIIVGLFLSAVQCVSWINAAMGDKVLGTEGIFSLIAGFSGLLISVIIIWLLAIGCYFLEKRLKVQALQNMKLPGYLWLGVLVLLAAVLCFMLWDVNTAGNADRYGSLGGYLTFDDGWGTNRGYIWRNTLECFGELSPFKMIVGSGPDTLGILLAEKTDGNAYNQIFDSAHNEYLHYLVTVGIAGLAVYLVFLGSFCVRIIKRCKDNPLAIGVLIAVVCYLVQAFVNLNLPVATPLVWTLIGLGELCSRDEGRLKAADTARLKTK